MQAKHSWNANWIATSAITFRLQRHADHHLIASRPYQVALLSPSRPHKWSICCGDHGWLPGCIFEMLAGPSEEGHLRYAQALQDVDEAPQLPASYPAMALLALFPGLFFDVMNPRLEEYIALTASIKEEADDTGAAAK